MLSSIGTRISRNRDHDGGKRRNTVKNHPAMDLDCFDVGQLLGRGGFASVYRARNRRTGKVCALKIMEKETIRKHKMEDRVVQEVIIHARMRFPGIVRFYGHFEDEENVYMVLELCEGGNLYRLLKQHGPLREREAAKVIKQLLQSLQYMHERGVIHRDLKLSNVLLERPSSPSLPMAKRFPSVAAGIEEKCRQSIPFDSPTHAHSSTTNHTPLTIKLCDFGLAILLEHPDEEHFTLCGTPNYIAPEVASQRAHGYPADLWSAGCLFHSLVTGAPPFEQGDIKETLQCIVRGEYEEPSGLCSSDCLPSP